jgi:hypothetical protein
MEVVKIDVKVPARLGDVLAGLRELGKSAHTSHSSCGVTLMRIFTIVLLLAAALNVSAANELTVDLSGPASVSFQVAPGDYFIRVINMLPNKEYAITHAVEHPIEGAISIAAAKKAAVPAPALPPVMAAPPGGPNCAALLTTAQGNIATAADEKAMSIATAPIRAVRSQCTGDIEPYLSSIELGIPSIAIRAGDVLTVTVTRTTPAATWTRIFTGGKRGDWLASYGLLFTPNRDANYSSFALGNNMYEVRRSRDREKFDYVPTLTFSYLRPKKAPQDWVLAPSFGLGYDLSSITGTFGLSYIYNHNFAVSAGLMMHRQRRLRGDREEGEHFTLTGTSVPDNNALTEMTWGPNVYVGITIRSLTNPFAP